MIRELEGLSTPYLKAILYSYREGFKAAVARYGLVYSEFQAIYSRYRDRLVDNFFREVIIDILFKRGESPEDISENIVWRDFEYLVYRFFDGYGYVVRRNVRIPGYRYEIDLVAKNMSTKFCLVIECKRWDKFLHPSQIRDIVSGLVEKALLLKNIISDDCVGVVPIIITLRRGKLTFYDGVPIIPINYLKDFINNLSYFIYSGEVKII